MMFSCVEIIFPDKYCIQLSDVINSITAIATFGLAVFAIFQINGIINGNRNVIKTNLTNYELEIVKLNFEIINISEKIKNEINNRDVSEILKLYNKQEIYIGELFLMTDSLCFYLESLSSSDKVRKLYSGRVNKIYNNYETEINILNYKNIKKFLNK